MRMLKLGAVLTTIWAGLNALVAVGVTVSTLLRRPPPALALVMPEAEIAQVDPRAIGVVWTQAAIANPVIVALCVLVLVVTWKGVVARLPWALPAVAGVLVPVQVMGFVSDAFIGSTNLVANAVSTVVLVAALGTMWVGTRQAGAA